MDTHTYMPTHADRNAAYTHTHTHTHTHTFLKGSSKGQEESFSTNPLAVEKNTLTHTHTHTHTQGYAG